MGAMNPVLVVDDQTMMRHAICSVLRDIGFAEPVEASDGREAMELMKTHQFAAVIADSNLTGLSGLGLLRWVRSQSDRADLPFMLVSTDNEPSRVRAAQDAGVDEFMVKPFTAYMLMSKLRRLLRLRDASKVPVFEPLIADDKVLGVTGVADVDHRVRGSTVLVVDDVPANVDVISALLQPDYSVVAAYSGQEALRLMQGALSPDIVLLDVSMPEMNGFDVCRTLKSEPKTRDIPVIFLTAMDQVEDIVHGLDIGAVDYVMKPAEPSILRARLATHLRLRHAYANLRRQHAALVASARLRDDVERITQHDLKNPLGAIIQGADLLLTRSSGDDRAQRTLRMVKAAAWRAVDIVNQSLNLYSIESGTFQLRTETVDLFKELDELCAEMRLAFANRGVEFKLLSDISAPEPSRFLGSVDPSLCHSLFGNLLRNAAEAAGATKIVTVSLSRDKQHHLTVAIHNDGLVPDAIRDRFFEKYVTAGKEGGLGLGTYSAKLVAEAQRGIIAMRSAAGLGTTVTVDLPIASG